MLQEMNRSLTGLFMTIFIFSLVAGASAKTSTVARVGSVPITDFELNQKLNQLVPMSSSFHSGVSTDKVAELREKAYSALVERALMTQYAIDEEIALTKNAVNSDLERIRSSFQSKRDFKNAMGGLSVADLRAAIYRKLLADKALEVAVNDKVNVTDESVKEYYQKNMHRFMRPKQFRASHILLKVDPSSTQEQVNVVRKKAEDLLAKAKAGEDFYNLAYYNSDDRTKFVGGDLGLFHRGQIQEEVEAELVTMKVGEVSGPVRSLYGFHIVKLTELNPERQMTFDEMRVKLFESERSSQYDRLKEEWLQILKAKYKVERLIP